MPDAAVYVVSHALAIGEKQLGPLVGASISNNLCGQVLSVNCGKGDVKAVVASVCNKGEATCGVDLIRKTWDLATGNENPGEAHCAVELTGDSLISGDSPKCFFRPSGEYGNPYYASVGLFNTHGKLPASATLTHNHNQVSGTFNGDSAYFDFSGHIGPHEGSNTVFTVTFTDGTTFTTPYHKCIKSSMTYIWSS